MLPMREQALTNNVEKKLQVQSVKNIKVTPISDVDAISCEIKPVKLWQALQGKITQVAVYGNVFMVKDGIPDTEDPIKIAEKFVDVFDVTDVFVGNKTKVIKKNKRKKESVDFIVSSSVINETSSDVNTNQAKLSRGKINETELPFIHVNKIAIHKTRLIDIYRRFPNGFYSRELNQYFCNMYKDVSKATCYNKHRAYIQYMIDQNIIKKDEEIHEKFYFYKFVTVPFNVD